MENIKTNEILTSIASMLKHIKEVEASVLKLSNESADAFVAVIQTAGLHMSDDVVRALQYHDIIAQQISAISEAVDLIDGGIDAYLDSVREEGAVLMHNIDDLSNKLSISLEEAQKKSKAFSGNALGGHAEELAFFE